MKYSTYGELQKAHREELNAFPIAYAFNKEQLERALEKLGATRDEVVSLFGHGDIVRKADAKSYIDMLERHIRELQEHLKEDETWSEKAFLYEMDNHEYAINMDGDEEVLRCFAMDWDDLEKWGLEGAYRRARNSHMKHMHDWDII